MAKTYVMFWIKSSKGTDDRKVVAFTGKPNKARIEDVMQRWCEAHSCWNHGENRISYGWRNVKIPPRRELLKAYNKVCERKRKAEDRWKTLAAMLNPMATTY